MKEQLLNKDYDDDDRNSYVDKKNSIQCIG